MKKILLSVVLLMVAVVAFAQIKTVKEAKSAATAGKFDSAVSLINQALENEETMNLAETWNVAGEVQFKIAEAENTKLYLQKEADEPKLCESVYKMFGYYMKCDELAQIPDEKGKVSNKYRKPNGNRMKEFRPNLINGGVTYFNENKNDVAYDYFGMYIESASHPLLIAENYVQTDTFLTTIAYYATLAAIKVAQDLKGEEANVYYQKALRYADLAAQDKENGKFGLEFKATALKEMGDTVTWINTLQYGVANFPEHPFFFAHLIDYYSNTQKYDEALQFADDMIAKEGETAFYTYVKGYLYQSMKDFDNAIVSYKRSIELDPAYAEAYSNLGLSYCQKAIAYGEVATSDLNDPNYASEQQKIKNFYGDALPYYEKVRELRPDNRQLWLNGLYTIYYKLGVEDKFEEIEAIMNEGY